MSARSTADVCVGWFAPRKGRVVAIVATAPSVSSSTHCFAEGLCYMSASDASSSVVSSAEDVCFVVGMVVVVSASVVSGASNSVDGPITLCHSVVRDVVA